MKKIRISAISYLNTLPFLHGLERSPYLLSNSIMELDIPSVCAEKLIRKKSDIGIVPVAILPELQNYRIISDYCIGAVNKVRSVLLLSEQPVENIRTVILDYHSRTSVQLMKILADKHWKISPEWVSGKPGFEKTITGTTAGVVIGDRAMEMEGTFRYSYDLAEAWNQMTGLPFVFACWVSVSETPGVFLTEFNLALKYGLSHIGDVIAGLKLKNTNKITGLNEYFTENVSYNLDDNKQKAMDLFLKMIKAE